MTAPGSGTESGTNARPADQGSPTRIVLGVDGSEGAARAVRWCAGFARRLDAEVIAILSVSAFGRFVLAVPPSDFQAWKRELEVALEEWCAPLRDAGIPYRSAVVEGGPADTLIKTADREAASFIVAGTRGEGGFAGLLLGSVGYQLASHSTCPVVLVPPTAE